jgi:hypothetical protein
MTACGRRISAYDRHALVTPACFAPSGGEAYNATLPGWSQQGEIDDEALFRTRRLLVIAPYRVA